MTYYKTDKTNLVSQKHGSQGAWPLADKETVEIFFKTAHHLTEMVTNFHNKSYNELVLLKNVATFVPEYKRC